MKISFVGLSCFLIENSKGDTLAIDPFYDTPEYSLGPKLPKNFQADLFLVSHPDEDHSQLHHTYIKQQRKSADKDESDGVSMFPEINIKGTLVKEYNGDLNIAWSFSIDGFRILHLADNAHLLTDDQLREIGEVDIVFIPMPKAGYQTQVQNIKALNPKVVIPSHLVLPGIDDEDPSEEVVKSAISEKVLQDWITNPHANEQTVDNFTQMFFTACNLKVDFPLKQVFTHTLEVEKLPEQTTVMLIRKSLSG